MPRHIRGPLVYNTHKIVLTGNYTIVNESLVIVNKTVGAATTLTMPPSQTADGRREVLVVDAKGDAGTNSVTIAAAGSDTINGAATYVLASNYGSVRLIDAGGGAWILAADVSKTEESYLSGVTPGTQAASKAVVADSNVNTGVSKVTQLWIGASGSEVQLGSTPAEIDNVCRVSTRLVDCTTATLAVTAAAHAGKTVLLDTTHTQTVTLPQATGTGNRYVFVVKTLGTDGSKIIQVANSTDVISGSAWVSNTQNTTDSFLTSASSDTITMNNTTQGGLVGAEIVIQDIATGVFSVRVQSGTTGNPATPFSANV